MSISYPYVEDFFELHEQGKIVLNKERLALIKYLKNVVLSREDVYFESEQIENCIAFIEKWFFKLEKWQKFLICFIFLYFDDKTLVFNEYFYTMARGAGKNGLISGLSAYFTTPLHGIREYDVAIVANSEEQAKVSFTEIFNMLEANPFLKYTKTKNRRGIFRTNKQVIHCIPTGSEVKYLTSNAGTKDSFRHGMLIFDEVHEYKDNKLIETLQSGLGKKSDPRSFFISTNGFVRDGVYDRMLRDAMKVMEADELVSGIFPWICTLDERSEVEDIEMWQKANPMFHPPMSSYARNLFSEVQKQWNKLLIGEGDKAKWLTKRMNISDVDLESSVASKEEIYATNREIPNFYGLECVAGLDFASLKDFAAIGLLFKIGKDWVWYTHSFVLKEAIANNTMAITSEIPKWEEKGLLTVIDDTSIKIEYIIDWLHHMEDEHKVRILEVVGDTFRMDYVGTSLKEAGFETEIIRRSHSVEASIAPKIEVAFADKNIVFGDNPLMRWYTNNVYVARDSFGNMVYKKVEERRRKTDGFMAFFHAFFKGVKLLEEEAVEDFMFFDYTF